jgi:hypothetical protein
MTKSIHQPPHGGRRWRQRAHSPEALDGTALWWRWFVTVTVAELLGFCAPLLVGTLTAEAGAWIAIPALLAAGAVEGATLGVGQAAVLARVLPRFPARRWVLATAVAAVVCYALGLVPSTAANVWVTWPPAVVALVGAVVGLALLGAMGSAQWWVLRHHLPRAALWIPATAAAWIAGLAAFLGLAMPWWQPGQPTVLVLVIGLVAAVAMAAAVAAITGWALVRLLAGPRRHRG